MSSKIKISKIQARRMALNASLLYGNKKLPKGKDGTLAVIDHLGYTQIDTISVIARAHHHTLWTRCPDYKPEYLHQLLTEDRAIFEYWGHAMSYLPMDDYRFYMHEFKRFKKPSDKWSRMRFEQTETLLPKILNRIKNEGALGSKDFENTNVKKSSGWWDWKPAKVGLELLFWQGKLMVSERHNFHRKYDLASRVLPNDINTTTPTNREQTEFWIRRALESYGIATISDIKKHIMHCNKKEIAKHIAILVANSTLLEIEVDGLSDKYYAVAEQFESTYPIKKYADKLHILSPFDNFTILRERMQKLFDFKYTIECYVPQPKRKYGYFVLPILWGDRLVGRLDAKADRKVNELIVHNIYLEDNFSPTNSFTKAFAKKLLLFAKFNNCNSISITKTKPKSLRVEIHKNM